MPLLCAGALTLSAWEHTTHTSEVKFQGAVNCFDSWSRIVRCSLVDCVLHPAICIVCFHLFSNTLDSLPSFLLTNGLPWLLCYSLTQSLSCHARLKGVQLLSVCVIQLANTADGIIHPMIWGCMGPASSLEEIAIENSDTFLSTCSVCGARVDNCVRHRQLDQAVWRVVDVTLAHSPRCAYILCRRAFSSYVWWTCLLVVDAAHHLLHATDIKMILYCHSAIWACVCCAGARKAL